MKALWTAAVAAAITASGTAAASGAATAIPAATGPDATCPAAETLATALRNTYPVTVSVTDGAPGYQEEGRSVIAVLPSSTLTDVGDAVAERGHRDRHTEYVMWNRTYWPAGAAAPTPIEDRGDRTLNAENHVRIVIERTKCTDIEKEN